jgi:hypothetical protein
MQPAVMIHPLSIAIAFYSSMAISSYSKVYKVSFTGNVTFSLIVSIVYTSKRRASYYDILIINQLYYY